MNNRLLSNKVIFWTIILSALAIVIIVYSAIFSYQVREQRIQATLTAAPTATAEALELSYQKGIGYLNTGRWLEAQAELEFVFEKDRKSDSACHFEAEGEKSLAPILKTT